MPAPTKLRANIMWRRILLWLAPLFVAGSSFLSPLAAQPPTQEPSKESSKDERGPPAPQVAVAILFTILVLVMICYPSRKA